MDDLEILRAAGPRPEGPSHAAYSSARAALLERAAAPAPASRRRVPAMKLAFVALAAGTAAVATVIATASTPPADPSYGVQESGRQILLAAATAAATTPEESGTYWYVKTTYTKTANGQTGRSSIETWTRRDGGSWVREGGEDKAKDNERGGHWSDGFDLGEKRLSYEQIQRLPTDPEALVTWLVQHAGEPPMPETRRIVPLINVLSSMPAPPAVRAAAFRALASSPNVRSLGTVNGGEGLAISYPDGEVRVVVDPEAARLRESAFTGPGKPSGTIAVEAAEWTDDLPEVAH
ncbi:CU044_5270 family protein [Nonomuraea sediminis]|uniref:CU044_5270 family protein n=1 Tax=Nonomuraea sediminis TaxID=2835864 RepID=UPI001BDBDC49|nr:CU044_5270 family protein [Nonomuraea sediminis]